MSWIDQGRQYHGWFGHGTAAGGDKPPSDGDGALFELGNFAGRIDAMAYSAVAHMSKADRRRDSASFDQQRLERLRKIMTALTGTRSRGAAALKDPFLDPSTSGAAIAQLRAAAAAAKAATTHRDLTNAAAELADAMRTIGLGKWPRFLEDAAKLADLHRTVRLAQLGTPANALDTSSASGGDSRVGPALAEFQARFDAATKAAYQQYSNDCSGYLRAFLIHMGFPDTPPRSANEFMHFVGQEGSGWKQVANAAEAVQLSAAGNIVVVGLAKPEGHGHVEVVGPKMMRAGVVAGRPLSPQVYSGSSSSWRGSKSQGENTVADGWNGYDVKLVTYWVKL